MKTYIPTPEQIEREKLKIHKGWGSEDESHIHPFYRNPPVEPMVVKTAMKEPIAPEST